jgi:hypothetical protein
MNQRLAATTHLQLDPQHNPNLNEEHYTIMWGGSYEDNFFETFYMKNGYAIPT